MLPPEHDKNVYQFQYSQWFPSVPVGFALTAICCHAAFGQNLLQNPSFETPSISGSYASFSGPSWTVTVAAVIIPKGYTESDAAWPTPTDGSQLLDIYGSSGISQNVTLTGSTSYSLQFDLGSLIQPTYSTYSVPAGVTASIVNATGGTPTTLVQQNFTVPFNTGFVTESLNFSTAAAGTYQVVVNGLGSGYYTALDNFKLTAAPEPQTFGIVFGIALFAFGSWRRFTR